MKPAILPHNSSSELSMLVGIGDGGTLSNIAAYDPQSAETTPEGRASSASMRNLHSTIGRPSPHSFASLHFSFLVLVPAFCNPRDVIVR